jgi:hypothetical protein
MLEMRDGKEIREGSTTRRLAEERANGCLSYLTLWLASYSTYRSGSCLRFYLLLLEGLGDSCEGGKRRRLVGWCSF